MAYMLIGFDKETWNRINHRFDRMVARGVRPYPMPFDQTRRDPKHFHRWAVLNCDHPFSEYDPKIASTRSAALRRWRPQSSGGSSG